MLVCRSECGLQHGSFLPFFRELFVASGGLSAMAISDYTRWLANRPSAGPGAVAGAASPSQWPRPTALDQLSYWVPHRARQTPELVWSIGCTAPRRARSGTVVAGRNPPGLGRSRLLATGSWAAVGEQTGAPTPDFPPTPIQNVPQAPRVRIVRRLGRTVGWLRPGWLATRIWLCSVGGRLPRTTVGRYRGVRASFGFTAGRLACRR